MTNIWLRNYVLLALMLSASGLTLALHPTQKTLEQGRSFDLAEMIPRTFGEWREEQNKSIRIIDPQEKEMIDKIYTQTLSRTYVNTNGYRIMLSIAYGDDQRDGMDIHYPEVCYPAQGFVLEDKQRGTLSTVSGSIPVTRILTSLGQRNEPVTYWTIIGNRVFQGNIQKKLIEMSFGLDGMIPDGMLIRVSSIDAEKDNAFSIQAQFSNQMFMAMTPESRQKFSGISQLN
jgi:EpsI family protein